MSYNYRSLFIGIDTPITLKNGKKVRYINFDNGATTPPMDVAVKAVMENTLIYGPIARGAGQKGDLCTEKYENGRNKILKFFNLEDSKTHTVVYTKNTTEGINILANILIKNKEEKVLTTRMEHHANDLPWRNKATVEYVEVDELGRVSINEIEKKLIQNKGKIKYVSITGASNVTGYTNSINEIAIICHKYGAKIIVDGAQLIAHKKVDMKGENKKDQIDFLVFSAHKAYAPYGSGAIVGLKEELEKEDPFLKGGGCVDVVGDYNIVWNEAPHKDEAGTSNFLGVMAMVSSLEQLRNIGFDNIYKHEMQIKDYLINEMKKIKEVIIYGDTNYTQDKLGVITFNIDKVHCEQVAHKFADDFGIALRYSKFCAHPYVNRLLGISDEKAYIHAMDENLEQYGMVRVSLGLYNTLEEAEIFIKALKSIIKNN